MKSAVEIHDAGEVPKFSLLHYLLEVLLTYGLLIGVNYLYQLQQLPYFLMLGIFAFFDSLSPFKYEHLLIFLAYPMLVGNSLLGCEYLSYPTVLICYLGVAVFQKRNKLRNLLPIYMLVLIFVYGWLVLPAIYTALSTGYKFVYLYIYPAVDLLLELLLDMTLILINEPQQLYFEMYLFLLGLQFGTAMTIQMTEVEFWYLCVIYSLRLVNSRKQFLSGFIRRGMVRLAFLNITVQKRCLAYRSGFFLKYTLHCAAIIFIYNYLKFNNYPHTSQPYALDLYASTSVWYQPLVLLAVLLFYELICLKFDPSKPERRRILPEFRRQTFWITIKDSLVNVMGAWIFYMGYYLPKAVVNYQ